MTDKPLLINYNQLHTLWMKWLSQPDTTHFDRWLKREAADWRKRFRETMPLELGSAMQHALRFRQLACALELIQERGLDQDWQAWAEKWRPMHAEDLARNNFWFWIQRRSYSQWYIPNDWQAGSRKTTVDDTANYVRQNPDSPLAYIWYGIDAALAPAIQRRAQLSGWSDSQRHEFMRMQQSRPPLWLRAKASEDQKLLCKELQNNGVEVNLNSHGLCATGGFGVPQTEAYKAGRVEIQDFASQQIAAAVNAQPGEKIWDACAGAGGKTLSIADGMKGKGAVVATDLKDYKLTELKKRAKRAGIANIRTFVWDGSAALRLPAEIARQKGFDKVLIDAPCTATGTWRRNPDARSRLSDNYLNDLQALQQQLLGHACSAVRHGGRLIYATCSWLAEENEDAIETFLSHHEDFTLISTQMIGAPDIDSDTMFVAVLEKKEETRG